MKILFLYAKQKVIVKFVIRLFTPECPLLFGGFTTDDRTHPFIIYNAENGALLLCV